MIHDLQLLHLHLILQLLLAVEFWDLLFNKWMLPMTSGWLSSQKTQEGT